MIRLSKMADYGIVLLTYVAQGGGTEHLATARDLAERSGLPLPTVSKVVKTLARGGLLKSHRGVHGGYSLARASRSISVVDVIAAMEGPVAMTACTGGTRARCSLLSTCPTRGAWALMNARVQDALATMSLDDMRGAAAPRLGRPRAAAGPLPRPTAGAAGAGAPAKSGLPRRAERDTVTASTPRRAGTEAANGRVGPARPARVAPAPASAPQSASAPTPAVAVAAAPHAARTAHRSAP